MFQSTLQQVLINSSTSDSWVNVTLGKMVPYDIEKFPLHIRITSNTETNWFTKTVPILNIEFEYPNNGKTSFELTYWTDYYGIWAKLTKCGNHFRSPIDEIPTRGTEYVVNVTSESLHVTRNGTEVTSVYFADFGQECENIWSENKVWVTFKENSKLEYRPHSRGK